MVEASQWSYSPCMRFHRVLERSLPVVGKLSLFTHLSYRTSRVCSGKTDSSHSPSTLETSPFVRLLLHPDGHSLQTISRQA
jgi:hypothetical protein